MEYTIIRSKRKTISLEVKQGGAVIVRAPARCSRAAIDSFVAAHSRWLESAVRRVREQELAHPEPDEAQQAELIRAAREFLPKRMAYFAAVMGLCPTGVRITSARTRFGSCSAKNSLCFSWRLMQYPDECIDYVVVHELAHIVHKNHGPEFYALIASVLPDYRERIKKLKG